MFNCLKVMYTQLVSLKLLGAMKQYVFVRQKDREKEISMLKLLSLLIIHIITFSFRFFIHFVMSSS